MSSISPKPTQAGATGAASTSRWLHGFSAGRTFGSASVASAIAASLLFQRELAAQPQPQRQV